MSVFFGNKLSQCLESGDCSDITLILNDEQNTIEMHVHKLIIRMCSPYFEKMFLNFKESASEKILINVQNAPIARDIIESFYGKKIEFYQKNLSYYLDFWICENYFGLDFYIPINPLGRKFDFIEKIKNIDCDFENLLDKIEIIGYNEYTLRLIVNNIPEDYDLNKLPLDMLKQLYKYTNKYNFVKHKRFSKTFIRNLTLNKNCELCYYLNKQNYVSFVYSQQKNTIAYIEKYYIYIISLTSRKLVTKLYIKNMYGDLENFVGMDFIPETNNVAILEKKYILIVDINTKNIVSIFQHNGHSVNGIKCAPDGKIFIWFFKTLHIYDIKITSQIKSCWFEPLHIYDTKITSLIKNCCFDNKIRGVNFSPDGKYFVLFFRKNNKICVFDINNYERFGISFNKDLSIAMFSSDGKYIISNNRGHKIIIWNTNTCEIIKIIRFGSKIDFFNIFDDELLVVTGNEIIIHNMETDSEIETLRDDLCNDKIHQIILGDQYFLSKKLLNTIKTKSIINNIC
ncbi:BTB/POZ domain-containing protein [Cotonvirus japonicus]|uniref:BTB/POZ domain-containing protein n=1 Tax=Cotonvirus japonicus TaxID=2811091 RepID=A0ABM7NRJ8_9VIRU|nr:BTB/POZ domain-containing protein [Cotonvirus japonicus]BCS82781.1 BTB/POZ domain-containing protein [Cotonvirus japonicus]